MCGLFASIGFAPDPARIDVVAHRGPDGRGWEEHGFPSGPLALGHRRLSIIDLSDAGLQPMADASGRWRLIFNGEIYNYVELRRDLEALGQSFTTRSDSEVLLSAWRVWGEAALPRLRGMFAFVILDRDTGTLHAARDRFGIKPLYLLQRHEGIAFASEIKQLVGLGGAGQRMNLPRVRDYLATGLIDHTDETLFEGIGQLRPGECATVALGGPSPRLVLRRWYRPRVETLKLSSAEAADRFRALLDESVRLHLRSDVPIGSCLSGGLDSSAIVCLAARLLGPGTPMTTVSAVYPGETVDERQFAEAAARFAGTKARFVTPRADELLERASELTWHQDEPFGSTSIFAQWCVFADARRAGLKVMLDGQGADEMLAGYHHAFALHLAGLLRAGRPGEALRVAIGRRRLHGAGFGGQIGRLALAMLPTGLSDRARGARHGWLSPALAGGGDAATTAAAGAGLSPPRDVADLCRTMTFASNLQMLLHWEDRNSMAHGIEARVPFLDHPLVEFALALGNDHKIVGTETKHVLRRAMRDAMPEAIVDRQDKIGFATPEGTWFRGPLASAIRQGLEETVQTCPDLFEAGALRRMGARMLDGSGPPDFALWRVVNLGLWSRRFGVSP